ncbi:MAG: hypothetical protein M3R12_03600 [Actinomycetota bacterium]|nr:hypothetical protein [Actinomycetota bacterium]
MRRALSVIAASALVLAVAGSAAARRDHAAVALNVLPPGQAGDVSLGKHSTD